MIREMKDSGIAWIGEIPKGWKVELIGNQVKEVCCPNIDCKENNALQFKMGSIISKSKGNSKYTPETLEGYNVVDKGVIMLNGLNLSFDFISQRIGLVKERGVITSTYIAIKPTNSIDSEFLTYLFKAYDNCKVFHSMGKGLRQTLSYGELKKYQLLYPNIKEQQKIAEFLDRKCGEIDELVALQEKMIEELKAYKQSVITEAVTKGLNPNVSMKDSGIEWIDYVPQHWKIRKMKSIIDLKSGSNLTAMEISEMDDGYLVYGGNGVRGTYGYYSHEGDYVLIGRQGALCGNINYASGKFWVTEHALVCYLKERCALKWLGELLRAMDLNQYSLSAAQPGLSAERIRNLYIIVPPLTEQQQIADYLDRKCAEIDELVALKQQKIDSLKEYKKSLIYEYVTGKKEVI